MALAEKLKKEQVEPKPKILEKEVETEAEVTSEVELQNKETLLNQAAIDLLHQLPDHADQLVHSLAKQYQQPIWRIACGMWLALHLEGRMSEFRVDPAWKHGFKTRELTCQYKPCGKKFPPRHIGQLYCSNECGLSAADIVSIPRENVKNATISKPKFDTNKPGDSGEWADSIETPLEAA